MSTSPPEKQKRFGMPGCWTSIAVVMALVSGCFAIQRFVPSPKVQVNRETTYLTEPLSETGLPDYVAHVQSKMRGNATPENNAAVLLWQAMWPGELKDEFEQVLLCDELGMDVPKESYDSQSLSSLALTVARWLENAPASAEVYDLDIDHAGKQTYQAMWFPWRSEDFPPVAEWLDENQERLDLVVEASKRSEYYSPYPEMLGDPSVGLMFMNLAGVQNLQEAVRVLGIRTMNRIAVGQYDSAWSDIASSFRLARHAGSSPLLIECVASIALDGMATHRAQMLLAEPELDLNLAWQIYDELQQMQPTTDFQHVMDQGERLAALDAIARLADGRWSFNDLSPNDGNGVESQKIERIDWNVIFRKVNHDFDRIAEITRVPRDERTRLEADIEEGVLAAAPGLRDIAKGFFSIRARSEAMANLLVAFLLPPFSAANSAADRQRGSSVLLRTSAAIAVFRAKNGSYPESLDVVASDLEISVPVDPYSGSPLIYQKRDVGYLLYSVFENGVDDGGDHIDGTIVDGEYVVESGGSNLDKTDLVIRVPFPKFKLLRPLRTESEGDSENEASQNEGD